MQPVIYEGRARGVKRAKKNTAEAVLIFYRVASQGITNNTTD
jgi:hypothetical protein